MVAMSRTSCADPGIIQVDVAMRPATTGKVVGLAGVDSGALAGQKVIPRKARKLKSLRFSAISGIERRLRMKAIRYRPAVARLFRASKP
jgi:hypothetical protein